MTLPNTEVKPEKSLRATRETEPKMEPQKLLERWKAQKIHGEGFSSVFFS